MPESPVTSCGPYRIHRVLGRGGMGVVYAATRMDTGMDVALKAMHEVGRQSPGARQRFLLEWAVSTSIVHPNLVRHFEAADYDGTLVLASELLSGGDLQARGAEFADGCPERLVLSVGRDIARGLHALHGRGFLHRDVKPSNIFLSAAGVAKLGDFGLVQKSGAGNGITWEGMALGTPDYMSPEQARGERDLDERSDIYSLGATLYWLATGRTPFESSTAWGVLTQIVGQDFPDPRLVRPAVSPRLASIILRACAKERDDRYRGAEDLADALKEGAFLPPPRPVPSPPSPARESPPALPDITPPNPAVLIVDDDPVITRLFEVAFEADGYDVRIAPTGAAAIAVAASWRADVIILDLVLPDGDGLDVLRRMRALDDHRDPPVVVLSNAFNLERREASMRAGVSAVLAKSTSPPRVVLKVVADLLPRRDAAGRRAEAPADLLPDEAADLSGGPLARMRGFVRLLESPRAAHEHDRALSEMASTCHGISAAASAASAAGSARIAAAAELLARHCMARVGDVTVSVLRTFAEAADCMADGLVHPTVESVADSPPTALVVDDDPVLTRMAASSLDRIGMPSRSTHDPLEALALVRDRRFDLVVLDVMMPGMSGLQLAERVRAVRGYQDVPIIFITSLKSFSLPRGLPGIVDLIAKPFPMMELATKALTLAERAKMTVSELGPDGPG